MTSSRKSLLQGIALIALGTLFLLSNFTELRARELWPLFVLSPGLYFFLVFLMDRTNYGVLMPATVLTVTGLLFFYCAFEGWYLMRMLWPLFIIGPGLGFLLMYILGKKEKGLLIPGAILSGIGGIFLLGFTESEYLWPVILIAIGVFLLLRSKRSDQPTITPNNPPPTSV